MDLNAVGRAQAEEVGRQLAGLVPDFASLDYVASPMLRTRATMDLLRQAAGLDVGGYRCDPRLAELAFGAWEGFTWKELRRREAARYAERDRDRWRFVPPGGGESYEVLSRRVGAAIAELTRPTVVVAHGGVARTMMTRLGGTREREALQASIWQGRILLFEGGRSRWFDAPASPAPRPAMPPASRAAAEIRPA